MGPNRNKSNTSWRRQQFLPIHLLYLPVYSSAFDAYDMSITPKTLHVGWWQDLTAQTMQAAHFNQNYCFAIKLHTVAFPINSAFIFYRKSPTDVVKITYWYILGLMLLFPQYDWKVLSTLKMHWNITKTHYVEVRRINAIFVVIYSVFGAVVLPFCLRKCSICGHTTQTAQKSKTNLKKSIRQKKNIFWGFLGKL